jgi:hypothetical protein
MLKLPEVQSVLRKMWVDAQDVELLQGVVAARVL